MDSFFKKSILSLFVVMAANFAFAQEREEILKFSQENAKMRREHTLKMKEQHLKHIGDYYDLKLKHQAQLDELLSKLKPDDEEGNKKITKEFKEKRKTYKKEEREFQQSFKKDIAQSMNEEYRQTMQRRHKGMRGRDKFKKGKDSDLE